MQQAWSFTLPSLCPCPNSANKYLLSTYSVSGHNSKQDIDPGVKLYISFLRYSPASFPLECKLLQDKKHAFFILITPHMLYSTPHIACDHHTFVEFGGIYNHLDTQPDNYIFYILSYSVNKLVLLALHPNTKSSPLSVSLPFSLFMSNHLLTG